LNPFNDNLLYWLLKDHSRRKQQKASIVPNSAFLDAGTKLDREGERERERERERHQWIYLPNSYIWSLSDAMV